MSRIVDALVSLPPMQDDYQRRGILGTLPERIRTQISDHTVARLHIIAIVQACQGFPDGADALVGSLALALGDGEELDRVATAIRQWWPIR